jgi:predicted DNA-binding antitoxin AbrB/MazE fold protein
MWEIIEAVFENGVLGPLGEPRLRDRQKVRIEIISKVHESSISAQREILPEFVGIGKSDSIDVARDHDRYLYPGD